MKIIITKEEIIKDDGEFYSLFEPFCDKPLNWKAYNDLGVTAPRLINECINNPKNNFNLNEISFIKELLASEDKDNFLIVLGIIESK